MVYTIIVIAAESNASFSIIERQTSRKSAPTNAFLSSKLPILETWQAHSKGAWAKISSRSLHFSRELMTLLNCHFPLFSPCSNGASLVPKDIIRDEEFLWQIPFLDRELQIFKYSPNFSLIVDIILLPWQTYSISFLSSHVFQSVVTRDSTWIIPYLN